MWASVGGPIGQYSSAYRNVSWWVSRLIQGPYLVARFEIHLESSGVTQLNKEAFP